ncbi:MAG: ribonuclease III [Thermostichales cyanobacterium DRC_bins_46]
MLPRQRQIQLQDFVARLGLPTLSGIDWHWLDQALIHPSANVGLDNDRLEFLGDAVLRHLATEFLFLAYPQATPGELTVWRSHLTSDRFLVSLAERFDLESVLIVGPTVNDLGRPRRLADAWEALLGALALSWREHSLPRLHPWLDPYFQAEVEQLQRDPIAHNPKAALQEWTQSRWGTLPEYRLVSQLGPANAPQFQVQVWIQGQCWGEGSGSSKKAAEAMAARQALQKLH